MKPSSIEAHIQTHTHREREKRQTQTQKHTYKSSLKSLKIRNNIEEG